MPRERIIRAAGVHPHRDILYKFIDCRFGGHTAWHPLFKWTQYNRGMVFTYDRACVLEDDLDNKATNPGMENGRWFAHGRRIYLYPNLVLTRAGKPVFPVGKDHE